MSTFWPMDWPTSCSRIISITFAGFSTASTQAASEKLILCGRIITIASIHWNRLILIDRIHHTPLEYVSYGKPNPLVFKSVETVLRQILSSHCEDHFVNKGDVEFNGFKTLYMIGDNPVVDIKGAREVCLFLIIIIPSSCWHWVNMLSSETQRSYLISTCDFRQDDLGFLF